VYPEDAMDILLGSNAELYMGFVLETGIAVEFATLREQPAHGIKWANIVFPAHQVKVIDDGAIEPPKYPILASCIGR
jgi:hypothetical protein